MILKFVISYAVFFGNLNFLQLEHLKMVLKSTIFIIYIIKEMKFFINCPVFKKHFKHYLQLKKLSQKLIIFITYTIKKH
jgi:hypothetical protein